VHHCDQNGFFLLAHRAHSPKHADLIDDVIPVSGRVQFLCEQSIKLFTHRNNPICHGGNVSFPLFKEASVRQDQRNLHMLSTFAVKRRSIPTYQTCPMRRRVADLTPLQNRELALHAIRRFRII
jgi:hypothetical protein